MGSGWVRVSWSQKIAHGWKGDRSGVHLESRSVEPVRSPKITSGEFGNNDRYVVVVQDLATQWIQSYPCKTKTSQETQRSLQKFLEPDRKPKVIYTDNSLEFGKACEDLSWNHGTSTPR